MMTRFHIAFASALFFVLFSLSAVAQIDVTPNRVILTPSERSKEISVTNPGVEPVIIETKIVYALLKSDSIGSMKYDSVDLGPTARPSCAEWAKAFPKRFTLPPGEKRTIRVLMSPPSGAEDGEYFARLIISSEPVERPIPVETDTTKMVTIVRTRLNLGMPIVFRKGKLVTGIDFDMIRPSLDPNGIRILAKIHPEGNTAYRGTLFAEVFADDGKSITRADLQVGAELDVLHPMVIPALSPGTYTLRIDAKPVRMGTAAETVLPAAEVTRLYRLAVATEGVSISPISSN